MFVLLTFVEMLTAPSILVTSPSTTPMKIVPPIFPTLVAELFVAVCAASVMEITATVMVVVIVIVVEIVRHLRRGLRTFEGVLRVMSATRFVEIMLRGNLRYNWIAYEVRIHMVRYRVYWWLRGCKR